MTIQEKDHALAEAIRSASKRIEAMNAEVQGTVAKTKACAERAAAVKVDQAQFEQIAANANAISEVQAQTAETIDGMQKRIQAVREVKVDTTGIQGAVDIVKKNQAQAAAALAAVQMANERVKAIKPNEDALARIRAASSVS